MKPVAIFAASLAATAATAVQAAPAPDAFPGMPVIAPA
jgi:hypothetical protein